MIIGGRHIRRGTHLLIIQRPGINRLVLIIVAAGASLILVAAVDLDVQRLPQDHLPFAAHTIAVMITARVTRDLALPVPSGGGPAAVVGFQLLPAARLGDVKPGAPPAPPDDDPLAGFVMVVDAQRPGSRS